MRILIIVLFQFLIVSAHSQSRDTYYGQDFYTYKNIWKNKELKKQLHFILANFHRPTKARVDEILASCNDSDCYKHISLDYRQARKYLFGDIHLGRQGKHYLVKDVYCEKEFIDSQFRSNPPGPFQIPDHAKINAEHTWPRSRFNKSFSNTSQLGDLHNLYPSDSTANSLRSNHPFANVNHVTNRYCQISKMGYRNSVDPVDYFEVPDAHKGNAARSVFYFSVRYDIKLSDVEEANLREWHFRDPVDAEERMRNDKVAKYQKNRNPFIDYPELVDSIQDF